MSSSPTVTFFDGYPQTYGGAQKVTHFLARELPARGFPTRVIVPAAGLVAEKMAEDGVHVLIVEPPVALGMTANRWRQPSNAVDAARGLPGYWRRLVSVLREAPGLVHANDHRGLILAGPPAKVARSPFVWHVHYAEFRLPMLNPIGGLLSSTVIVPTQANVDDNPALRRFGRPLVLPNPTAERPSREYAASDKPVVLCAVARMHPDKGLDTLLRAAAALVADGRRFTLVVAGAPYSGLEEYAESIKRLADELGLADVVQFPGFIDQLDDEFERASLYVQPSRREQYGLAVTEAMAAGVPVVACRAGGLADLVSNEVNGLLVPPDDPTSLAGAIGRVMDDPALAARLGRAGQEQARREYDPERFLTSIIAVYERALGRH